MRRVCVCVVVDACESAARVSQCEVVRAFRVACRCMRAYSTCVRRLGACDCAHEILLWFVCLLCEKCVVFCEVCSGHSLLFAMVRAGARREYRCHDRCRTEPKGAAPFRCVVSFVVSFVVSSGCASTTISPVRCTVTVRSPNGGPSDPRPVAFRAGSAPWGGVRSGSRAVPGRRAMRAGRHRTCPEKGKPFFFS